MNGDVLRTPSTSVGNVDLRGKNCYVAERRLPDGTVSRIGLVRGDCLDLMDVAPMLVGDAYVGAVVTSPPYNLGIRYSLYDDGVSRTSYLDWLERVFHKVHALMSHDGSLFLNLGASPKNPWGPMDVASRLRPFFVLQNTFIWVKSVYIKNHTHGEDIEVNVGHVKAINSSRFVNDQWEYVFHFTKSGDVPIDRSAIGVPFKDKTNLARWKRSGEEGLRCRGNVWYVPYETIQRRDKDRPHPASFPSGLVEMCLRLHGLSKRPIVLDPFSGIGTTPIAAGKLGLSSVGIEVDPVYHGEAVRRAREAFQDAHRIGVSNQARS